MAESQVLCNSGTIELEIQINKNGSSPEEQGEKTGRKGLEKKYCQGKPGRFAPYSTSTEEAKRLGQGAKIPTRKDRVL